MLEKLKKRLHRHKWHEYTREHPSANIIFYCRKCDCGAEQIRDKWGRNWSDLPGKAWRFNWEKEWFDNSVKQQKGQNMSDISREKLFDLLEQLAKYDSAAAVLFAISHKANSGELDADTPTAEKDREKQ